MIDLQGNAALITGGAGGIGAATAEVFLRAGARVMLVDLDQVALDDVAQRLAELGDVRTVVADVTSEDDTVRYVAETIAAFGAVDVFFNNAGIEGRVRPLIEVDVDDFDRLMAINVRGVFLGLKHVLPGMYERRSGSVINTSSNAGLHGTPGVAPYVTSKHALVGLTKVAALESAVYGVRVNSIHPSAVETRMIHSLEQGFNPDDVEAARAKVTSAIPLGHYASPYDVANLVMFLGSDASAFITGAQYRVDGGRGAA